MLTYCQLTQIITFKIKTFCLKIGFEHVGYSIMMTSLYRNLYTGKTSLCWDAPQATNNAINTATRIVLISIANSLWAGDALWRHRSMSALAQVMAWCLKALSHCPSHCTRLIGKALWRSTESNFIEWPSYYCVWWVWKPYFWNYTSPMGQCVYLISHAVAVWLYIVPATVIVEYFS